MAGLETCWPEAKNNFRAALQREKISPKHEHDSVLYPFGWDLPEAPPLPDNLQKIVEGFRSAEEEYRVRWENLRAQHGEKQLAIVKAYEEKVAAQDKEDVNLLRGRQWELGEFRKFKEKQEKERENARMDELKKSDIWLNGELAKERANFDADPRVTAYRRMKPQFDTIMRERFRVLDAFQQKTRGLQQQYEADLAKCLGITTEELRRRYEQYRCPTPTKKDAPVC